MTCVSKSFTNGMHSPAVHIYCLKEQFRNMFNLSKSVPDLKNKTDVQYKVICDWLRTTQSLVKRLEKRQEVILLDISKLYDLLLKDDSPPDSMELDYADSPSTEPVR